jgi:glycosyltransferase involved in cell wall biosynthesis
VRWLPPVAPGGSAGADGSYASTLSPRAALQPRCYLPDVLPHTVILAASMVETSALRIVQYHPRALVGDGGITNSVRHLSAAMARLGADAVIACGDAGRDAPAQLPVPWIAVRHSGPRGMRVPRGLEHVLSDADVLVCNSAWTAHNVAAARAARKLGVPYVLAPRGAYDPRIRQRRPLAKTAWWMLLEQRLVARARAVHVFFPEEREHLEAIGYRGDVLIAPNGVTVPDDAVWDGGSGGYVLYIGRFDPEHKGLDLLVRAAASLPAGAIPPIRLHGPDWRGGKEVVRDLVRDLGATDRVLVGDAVYGDEKWALLQAARAFVYPSRWEGFGNSTAEAAALGVPTLVTPYPLGMHMAHRGAAVLAEADVPALRAGLQGVCSPEAAHVGERAAQVVREELTWEAVARSWLSQLGALVEQRAS